MSEDITLISWQEVCANSFQLYVNQKSHSCWVRKPMKLQYILPAKLTTVRTKESSKVRNWAMVRKWTFRPIAQYQAAFHEFS